MSSAAAYEPKPAANEIKIVAHSNLFYWWPVWAVSLIMGFWSMVDGYSAAVVPHHSQIVPLDGGRAAVVPKDTQIITNADITFNDGKTTQKDRVVAMFPAEIKKPGAPEDVHLHMSSNKNLGVLFAVVLILVIFITNVPLRGMWSMVIVLLVVALTIIFWLAHIWESIIGFFVFLDIRINAAGYFVIGITLFIIWLLTILVFDRNVYVIFAPGQIKICTEIGGGQQVFDTTGVSLEKQRSDLFRHILLGLGSGDLIVKITGAQVLHFDFHNVLFIGSKVAKIELMLKSKAVVETR
jgi:hypothetical protein